MYVAATLFALDALYRIFIGNAPCLQYHGSNDKQQQQTTYKNISAYREWHNIRELARPKLSGPACSPNTYGDINWKEAKNAAQPVSEGDIISFRSRGRVEVAEIRGTTKKGRLSITLKRYI